MVGCINGCERVNIVILSVVHLSKFGCFFLGCWWGVVIGFVSLCFSSHEQSNPRLSLTVVFTSGPALK